jgi:hypothetical protein
MARRRAIINRALRCWPSQNGSTREWPICIFMHRAIGVTVRFCRAGVLPLSSLAGYLPLGAVAVPAMRRAG